MIFLGLSTHDTHLLAFPSIRACTVYNYKKLSWVLVSAEKVSHTIFPNSEMYSKLNKTVEGKVQIFHAKTV